MNTLASLSSLGIQVESLAQGNKAEEESTASERSSFANVCMNGSEVFKFAVRAVPMVSVL